jgi:hypothetical protein
LQTSLPINFFGTQAQPSEIWRDLTSVLSSDISPQETVYVDPTRFPELIRGLYGIVDELEAMFRGRRFTPDGHMVGSLGEAIASHYYRVHLFPASTEGHDGEVGGLKVQIKMTQGDTVALRSEPEHLLVFKLARDGSFTEEYNGPGKLVWSRVSHRPRPKNGQYQIGLSALRALMKHVPPDARIEGPDELLAGRTHRPPLR